MITAPLRSVAPPLLEFAVAMLCFPSRFTSWSEAPFVLVALRSFVFTGIRPARSSARSTLLRRERHELDLQALGVAAQHVVKGRHAPGAGRLGAGQVQRIARTQ